MLDGSIAMSLVVLSNARSEVKRCTTRKDRPRLEIAVLASRLHQSISNVILDLLWRRRLVVGVPRNLHEAETSSRTDSFEGSVALSQRVGTMKAEELRRLLCSRVDVLHLIERANNGIGGATLIKKRVF